MATNILSTKRAIWKPVKYFQDYYDLSKGLAYKLVAMEGFPKKYVAEKTIRVDMSKTDDFMQKMFNWEEEKPMKKQFKYKVRRLLFLYIPFILLWDAMFIYAMVK